MPPSTTPSPADAGWDLRAFAVAWIGRAGRDALAAARALARTRDGRRLTRFDTTERKLREAAAAFGEVRDVPDVDALVSAARRLGRLTAEARRLDRGARALSGLRAPAGDTAWEPARRAARRALAGALRAEAPAPRKMRKGVRRIEEALRAWPARPVEPARAPAADVHIEMRLRHFVDGHALDRRTRLEDARRRLTAVGPVPDERSLRKLRAASRACLYASRIAAAARPAGEGAALSRALDRLARDADRALDLSGLVEWLAQRAASPEGGPGTRALLQSTDRARTHALARLSGALTALPRPSPRHLPRAGRRPAARRPPR